MALANMTQEQTNQENRNHCKHIAEELEKYVNGDVYRCPECGDTFEWNDDDYNDDDYTYTCPHCKATFAESELEALSIYDWLEDIYDIEYRVDSRKELRSVRIMVACGGPNIYIDTATKQVELYWWSDQASYPISYDAAAALDEWAEEYWNCL
jgi:transposase-like protein